MKNFFIIAALFPFFVSCSKDNRDCDTRNCTDSNHVYNESDAQITDHVNKLLRNDKSLPQSARYVHVRTNKGTVTLTGDVASKEESYAIERKVKTIDGVSGVNNQLNIYP